VHSGVFGPKELIGENFARIGCIECCQVRKGPTYFYPTYTYTYIIHTYKLTFPPHTHMLTHKHPTHPPAHPH